MFINKLAKNACIACCMSFLHCSAIYAQEQQAPDTLRLDLKQAEKLFLDNNLELLAGHYHIQSAQELVKQARKWDNPILVTDQNVYANKKFFEHSNSQGEVYVQVQQLIRTAGKRARQANLAETNVSLAEWQFRSVMRSLRAELVKDFFTIAQLQQNGSLYEESRQQLVRLKAAMEAELNAGNIARKEYLRVQALLIDLQHDIAENDKSLSDMESELKTLLAVTGNRYIYPVAGDEEPAVLPGGGMAALTDSARHNNTDYQQEIYQLQYNQVNLRLQRSLAVPDLTVSPEYDQNSNYTNNYYGLTLSVPVPLWDRNKGNIRSAKYAVQEEEALVKHADEKLQNDVQNAYQKLMLMVRLASENNAAFYKDYYQLQKNISESYNKRQISLIEFLEYYKDYKAIREQHLLQVLNLRLAKQDLNDITGTDIMPLQP